MALININKLKESAGKAIKEAADWTSQAAKDASEWTSQAAKDASEWSQQAFLDATDWTKQAVVERRTTRSCSSPTPAPYFASNCLPHAYTSSAWATVRHVKSWPSDSHTRH